MTLKFGVATGQGNQNGYGAMADKGRAQFDRMMSFGITTLRINWSASAAVVNAAIAAGMEILMVVTGYNDNTKGQAYYVNTMLTPTINTWFPLGVKTYEIINEVNNPVNWNNTDGVTNPVKYTALLQASYTAAKAIDPSVQVMFSSPGGYGSYGQNAGGAPTGNDYPGWVNPLTFLEACYTAGAHGYFDIMGWHPYAFPEVAGGTQAWNCWYQMTDLATHSARNQMVTNGDGAKKIWITECGAPTDGKRGANPLNYPMGTYWYQAWNYDAMLNDLINNASNRTYIERFMPYCWSDTVLDGDWGLNDINYKPKMSLATVVKYTNPSGSIRWAGGTSGKRGRLSA